MYRCNFPDSEKDLWHALQTCSSSGCCRDIRYVVPQPNVTLTAKVSDPKKMAQKPAEAKSAMSFSETKAAQELELNVKIEALKDKNKKLGPVVLGVSPSLAENDARTHCSASRTYGASAATCIQYVRTHDGSPGQTQRVL